MRLFNTLSAIVLACFGSVLCVAAQDSDFDTYDDGTIIILNYKGSASTVIIPDTIHGRPVTRIGEYAFEDSANLTSVTIPNRVTNISHLPFYGCTNLLEITVDSGNPVYSSMNGVLFNVNRTTLIQCPEGKSGTYTIPDSVNKIENQAFRHCISLNGIIIPDNVTSIGYATFEYCNRLTNVILSSNLTRIANSAFFECISLTNVIIPDNVTTIDAGAFADCFRLTSVTIPNNVTNIGNSAFEFCLSLTNLIIPIKATNIGQFAFAHCSSLSNVTIPYGVTDLWAYTFANCTSLTNVVIPNTVTSIDRSVFSGCNSLTKVTIPASVTALYYSAFGYCINLKEIYFLGDAPIIYSGAFTNVNATIYYLPGRRGWGATFDGLPTALWTPQSTFSIINTGIQTNQFAFILTGVSNQFIVVESCTNLTNPAWTPLQTNTITTDSLYFIDTQWTNYPFRFYRIKSGVQ